MITNAEIKNIRALREKKFRDETGLFVVEGEKMVQEALDSDFRVVSVYRTEEIGEAAMAKISQLSTPSPVLAVVESPKPGPLDLPHALYLALDGVRDPGNMGTILRIADWFGISTVFASCDSVDYINPKVIQSTMGAIFRVKVVYTDIPALCRKFRKEGMPVYGTFLDGLNLYGRDLSGEGLIVMGNESRGISAETAAEVSDRLLIPKAASSKAESLNVAMATAITISEFRRRLI